MRVVYGPLHGGPRALKVKHKKLKTLVGHEIDVFLTDLHQILHARRCNNFLWFPHTFKPLGPLNRPKHFNLLFTFLQLLLFVAYFLQPIWAMGKRPVQGP